MLFSKCSNFYDVKVNGGMISKKVGVNNIETLRQSSGLSLLLSTPFLAMVFIRLRVMRWKMDDVKMATSS